MLPRSACLPHSSNLVFFPDPHKYKFVLPRYSGICDLPLEHGWLTSDYIHREKWLSTSQQSKVAHSYSVRDRTWCSHLLSELVLGLTWTCTGLVHALSQSGDFTCAVVLLCSENIAFFVGICCIWFLHCFCLLFCSDLSASGGRSRVYLFQLGLTILQHQHFVHVEACGDHCLLQKKLARQGLREPLIYGHSNKSLEVSLMLCSFSSMIVVHS